MIALGISLVSAGKVGGEPGTLFAVGSESTAAWIVTGANAIGANGNVYLDNPAGVTSINIGIPPDQSAFYFNICTNLASLYINDGPGTFTLESLYDLPLTYLDVSGNGFTSFDAEMFDGLTTLVFNGNLVTELDLRGCPSLQNLQATSLPNCTTINLDGLDGLTEANISDNYSVTSLSLQNNTALLTLNCTDNDLTTLALGEAPNLQTFTGRYNAFSSLDFSTTSSVNYVLVSDCGMSATAVDDIIIAINAHGTSNGTLLIDGNSQPYAAGLTAIPALVTRGWTVVTD